MLSLRRTPFSSMTVGSLEDEVTDGTERPPTMGNSLDLRGRPYGFVGGQATFRVDEVRGEDSVNQSGFPKTCLACSSA
jgi:hypothetical protein